MTFKALLGLSAEAKAGPSFAGLLQCGGSVSDSGCCCKELDGYGDRFDVGKMPEIKCFMPQKPFDLLMFLSSHQDLFLIQPTQAMTALPFQCQII